MATQLPTDVANYKLSTKDREDIVRKFASVIFVNISKEFARRHQHLKQQTAVCQNNFR